MEEEEQEGLSVHSPCQAPPSSASSLPKEQSEVELELKLLEALEIYPPNKLQDVKLALMVGLARIGNTILVNDAEKGNDIEPQEAQQTLEIAEAYLSRAEEYSIHRHIVLFGLMEFLRRSFDRDFSAEDILMLLDRFYNVDMLKSDDDDKEVLSQDEAFSLPPSFFVKEEL